jgi:predicted kinase
MILRKLKKVRSFLRSKAFLVLTVLILFCLPLISCAKREAYETSSETTEEILQDISQKEREKEQIRLQRVIREDAIIESQTETESSETA